VWKALSCHTSNCSKMVPSGFFQSYLNLRPCSVLAEKKNDMSHEPRHFRWWAPPGTAWDYADRTESYCLGITRGGIQDMRLGEFCISIPAHWKTQKERRNMLLSTGEVIIVHVHAVRLRKSTAYLHATAPTHPNPPLCLLLISFHENRVWHRRVS